MSKDIKDNPLYRIIAKQDIEKELKTMEEFRDKIERFTKVIEEQGSVNLVMLNSFMNSEIESFKQSNSKYLNNQ